VPAPLRSPAIRTLDALSTSLTASLGGRPGGRRVRLNASRSLGKIAHTLPTLIPYSRCLSSNRRTYASEALSSAAASATDSKRGRSIPKY
jgi:hypothetical protein